MEKTDFDVIFDENKNALKIKLNDELVAVIIKKLRLIAQQQMKKTGYANQFNTLQPTAIVNEIFMKLRQGSPNLPEPETKDFYLYCTIMIKNFLRDYMRQRLADKRGGDTSFLSTEDILDSSWVLDKKELDVEDFLGLYEVLDRFNGKFERQARIVDAKYFGGMKEQEISEWLDLSLSTVQKDLLFAKVWLRRELSAK